MNDNLHPVFQQILKPFMPVQDKLTDLAEQIKNNNYDLIDQVRTLKPEDQQEYSEKVSKLIERTKTTLKKRR